MQELRDVAIAIPGKERVGGEARAQQALGLSARAAGDDRELLGRDELRSDAGPCAAFADRLPEARQIGRLQIPQAAVQSAVVMKGGRAGEVVALDERDVQPAVAASQAAISPWIPPPTTSTSNRRAVSASRSRTIGERRGQVHYS